MSYAASGGGNNRVGRGTWSQHGKNEARTPFLTAPERAGAGPSGSPLGSPQGSPRGQEEKRAVEDAIKRLQRNIDEVQREKRQLNMSSSFSVGKGKVENTKGAAKATRDEAVQLIEGLNNKSKDASGNHAEKNHRRMMIQKLTDDVDAVWQGFEAACRAYDSMLADKEKSQASVVLNAVPGLDRGASGRVGVEMQDVETGQQLQVHDDDFVSESILEVHGAIVDETARDIGTLTGDIQTLQGAMRDLASHVVSQGEDLDNIESNMANTVESTTQANVQLNQATRYQRRGNKMIYGMLVLAAIFSILIVAVAIMHSNRG